MLGAPGLAFETWESTNLRNRVELMRRSVLFALLLAATLASAQPAKRPMTFEDLMHMKRLGSTAVSADGKWLGYSVTTVDLEKNTKTTELWPVAHRPVVGKRQRSDQASSSPARRRRPSNSPPTNRAHSLHQQPRRRPANLASRLRPRHRRHHQYQKKLTTISTEADDAKWSPDSKSIVFTSAVYPDCPAVTTADFATGDTCNKNRDCRSTPPAKSKPRSLPASSTPLKPPHRRQEIPSVSGFGRERWSPRPRPQRPTRRPTGVSNGPTGLRLRFLTGVEGTGIHENLDPEPAISTNADIFTLDLTNPAAKPVKVSTSQGGDFNPAYSPDGKYLAWRSQLRPGYESDKSA